MTVPTGFPVNDGPLIPTWPRMLFQIAWNAGGNSTSPNHWYTVSKRLRGTWKAALSGRNYELDSVQSGSMNFTLDNLDGAFDPDNSSSFFYPYVQPYRRARLIMQTPPSQNQLYPWVAAGTQTLSMAANAGTLTTTTGLSGASSGRTTGHAWALPNATAAFVALGLTGVTQDWAAVDCNGTTVTPGASYAFGVDVQLAAGGMTSLTIRPRIGWYTLTGTLISNQLGTTVAVTTAWSRLTVAGAAPANAAFALVSISTQAATTAATTVRATGWQLEQAAAATAWAGPGSWNQLWQGFVERYPQKYTNGSYGLVDVVCVDGLAPLSQFNFPDNVAGQFLAARAPANLQYVFDLATPTGSPDGAGGASVAYAATGGTAAASGYLDVVGANYASGVAITSTGSLGTLWNSPGPVTSLLSNQASSLGLTAAATYLQPWDGTDHIMLGAGPWTRLICFRTTNLPGSGGRFSTATLWSATAAGFISGTGDQSGAQAYISNQGLAGGHINNAAGTNVNTSLAGTNVCDGNWHALAITLSADGKTVQMCVDGGVITPTSASSLSSTTYTSDVVGALVTTNGSGENTQPFNGDIAYFAQWNTELSSVDLNEVTRAFATGWSLDGPNARVQRLLTLSGFHPGAQSAFTAIGTSSTLGGVSLTGRSAVDAIQQAADTENGQFAIDHFGDPTLYGHLWRWVQNTPIVTFGENPGEIPYAGDITFEQDPAHLYNDVVITCEGTADATDATRIQESTNSASATAYFPQSLPRTINPQYVSDGKNMADYLLSLYKDPHTRVGQITIDLADSLARQAAVVALRFSDLVRVMRRPTLAPAKQLDGFIEQLEYSGDDTGQVLQLRAQISPASQYDYSMISATWAALTTSPAAGVSVITVGPINANASIAAQFVIPGGYTMTLGYGTAGVETVTVQSVQTVAAGYATVQLTLTAPTANAHTTGDLICTPQPGGITLPPGGTYPTCFDAASLIGDTAPLIGF